MNHNKKTRQEIIEQLKQYANGNMNALINDNIYFQFKFNNGESDQYQRNGITIDSRTYEQETKIGKSIIFTMDIVRTELNIANSESEVQL